jgi:HD-GYP domain-containing protein (c-di-GMP phosphodiesterase class II)
MPLMSLPASGNESFDSLSALSVILDLANGFAEDKSLLTAVLALRLARELGAPVETWWSAALAALVRHLGCTAFAPTEAGLVEDDITLRRNLQLGDSSTSAGVFRAVTGASQSRIRKLASVGALMTQRASLAANWTHEACGAARVLARRLELGAAVELALDEVFERFDGRGTPKALKGEAISLPARLAQVSHQAVLAWLEGGVEHARAVLTAASGKTLDPKLVGAVVELLEGEPGAFLEQHHPALLELARPRNLVSLTALAAAFGDFADLQLPDGVGHSRAVAQKAEGAAKQLGFTAAEVTEVVQAAHLHDLGMVALPTPLWLTPRSFRPGERERARGHVSFTERVLRAAAPLAPIARIAAAHHERLDGVRDGTVPRTARLLAAADVWVALQSPRPHRPAMTREQAITTLRAEALDRACVEALIEAKSVPAPASALTSRELEVLRLLSRGLTNKEIAQALDISARTVQHHTIHVYEKLGVDTRAGATLKAAEAGLLA